MGQLPVLLTMADNKKEEEKVQRMASLHHRSITASSLLPEQLNSGRES